MLSLKKQGYNDEILNYYKLSIYDWDIEKAKQYYTHDDFCVPYAVFPIKSFGLTSFSYRLYICDGTNWGQGCNQKHTHNISDLIVKSSTNEDHVAQLEKD